MSEGMSISDIPGLRPTIPVGKQVDKTQARITPSLQGLQVRMKEAAQQAKPKTLSTDAPQLFFNQLKEKYQNLKDQPSEKNLQELNADLKKLRTKILELPGDKPAEKQGYEDAYDSLQSVFKKYAQIITTSKKQEITAHKKELQEQLHIAQKTFALIDELAKVEPLIQTTLLKPEIGSPQISQAKPEAIVHFEGSINDIVAKQDAVEIKLKEMNKFLDDALSSNLNIEQLRAKLKDYETIIKELKVELKTLEKQFGQIEPKEESPAKLKEAFEEHRLTFDTTQKLLLSAQAKQKSLQAISGDEALDILRGVHAHEKPLRKNLDEKQARLLLTYAKALVSQNNPKINEAKLTSIFEALYLSADKNSGLVALLPDITELHTIFAGALLKYEPPKSSGVLLNQYQEVYKEFTKQFIMMEKLLHIVEETFDKPIPASIQKLQANIEKLQASSQEMFKNLRVALDKAEKKPTVEEIAKKAKLEVFTTPEIIINKLPQAIQEKHFKDKKFESIDEFYTHLNKVIIKLNNTKDYQGFTALIQALPQRQKSGNRPQAVVFTKLDDFKRIRDIALKGITDFGWYKEVEMLLSHQLLVSTTEELEKVMIDPTIHGLAQAGISLDYYNMYESAIPELASQFTKFDFLKSGREFRDLFASNIEFISELETAANRSSSKRKTIIKELNEFNYRCFGRAQTTAEATDLNKALEPYRYNIQVGLAQQVTRRNLTCAPLVESTKDYDELKPQMALKLVESLHSAALLNDQQKSMEIEGIVKQTPAPLPETVKSSSIGLLLQLHRDIEVLFSKPFSKLKPDELNKLELVTTKDPDDPNKLRLQFKKKPSGFIEKVKSLIARGVNRNFSANFAELQKTFDAMKESDWLDESGLKQTEFNKLEELRSFCNTLAKQKSKTPEQIRWSSLEVIKSKYEALSNEVEAMTTGIDQLKKALPLLKHLTKEERLEFLQKEYSPLLERINKLQIPLNPKRLSTSNKIEDVKDEIEQIKAVHKKFMDGLTALKKQLRQEDLFRKGASIDTRLGGMQTIERARESLKINPDVPKKEEIDRLLKATFDSQTQASAYTNLRTKLAASIKKLQAAPTIKPQSEATLLRNEIQDIKKTLTHMSSNLAEILLQPKGNSPLILAEIKGKIVELQIRLAGLKGKNVDTSELEKEVSELQKSANAAADMFVEYVDLVHKQKATLTKVHAGLSKAKQTLTTLGEEHLRTVLEKHEGLEKALLDFNKLDEHFAAQDPVADSSGTQTWLDDAQKLIGSAEEIESQVKESIRTKLQSASAHLSTNKAALEASAAKLKDLQTRCSTLFGKPHAQIKELLQAITEKTTAFQVIDPTQNAKAANEWLRAVEKLPQQAHELVTTIEAELTQTIQSTDKNLKESNSDLQTAVGNLKKLQGQYSKLFGEDTPQIAEQLTAISALTDSFDSQKPDTDLASANKWLDAAKGLLDTLPAIVSEVSGSITERQAQMAEQLGAVFASRGPELDQFKDLSDTVKGIIGDAETAQQLAQTIDKSGFENLQKLAKDLEQRKETVKAFTRELPGLSASLDKLTAAGIAGLDGLLEKTKHAQATLGTEFASKVAYDAFVEATQQATIQSKEAISQRYKLLKQTAESFVTDEMRVQTPGLYARAQELISALRVDSAEKLTEDVLAQKSPSELGKILELDKIFKEGKATLESLTITTPERFAELVKYPALKKSLESINQGEKLDKTTLKQLERVIGKLQEIAPIQAKLTEIFAQDETSKNTLELLSDIEDLKDLRNMQTDDLEKLDKLLQNDELVGKVNTVHTALMSVKALETGSEGLVALQARSGELTKELFYEKFFDTVFQISKPIREKIAKHQILPKEKMTIEQLQKRLVTQKSELKEYDEGLKTLTKLKSDLAAMLRAKHITPKDNLDGTAFLKVFLNQITGKEKFANWHEIFAKIKAAMPTFEKTIEGKASIFTQQLNQEIALSDEGGDSFWKLFLNKQKALTAGSAAEIQFMSERFTEAAKAYDKFWTEYDTWNLQLPKDAGKITAAFNGLARETIGYRTKLPS
jgi:hypothetical protein